MSNGHAIAIGISQSIYRTMRLIARGDVMHINNERIMLSTTSEFREL